MAFDKRCTFMTYNSLLCILKALEGKCTTIDLQNESCITGKISTVDSFMNVQLEKVIYHDSTGPKYTFETFFIKSRNIRYVHIPKGINVETLIENYYKSLKIPKTKKVATYKSKRSKMYQASIINSLKKDVVK